MHTMDMLGAFGALRVEVPLSTSRVPAAIEALEARRQYYLTKRAQVRAPPAAAAARWHSPHILVMIPFMELVGVACRAETWHSPAWTKVCRGMCECGSRAQFVCLLLCQLGAAACEIVSDALVFGVRQPLCGAGKGERRGCGRRGQRARDGEWPL